MRARTCRSDLGSLAVDDGTVDGGVELDGGGYKRRGTNNGGSSDGR